MKIDMDRIARPNETVLEHLENVSESCSKMCARFGMEYFGRIIGMFHDAYKYSNVWQEYIRRKISFEKNGDKSESKISHALESAAYLAWRLGKVVGNHNLAQRISEMMAQCIVSHHGGLHDYFSGENRFMECVDRIYNKNGKMHFASTKEEMQKRTGIDFSSIDDSVFDKVLEKKSIDGLLLECGEIIKRNKDKKKDYSLTVRMICSCLVDADRLDAELHGENGDKKWLIRNDERFADMGRLDEMLSGRMNQLSKEDNALDSINILRTEIRNRVVSCACQKEGRIYSLLLPTGAGKTYTGIQVAVRIAKLHKKQRIIVLAPYTSVVDQTADEYTKIFSDTNVIEHQCDFDPLDKVQKSIGKRTEGYRDDENDIEERTALIAENWDAPIIVATTVQFFDSFWRFEASRLRKIHNVANSVIIIDEEQQIPPEKIPETTATVNLLTKHFGCIVIRSSATLPAFSGKIKVSPLPKFIGGYDETIELASDIDSLFNEFKRVEIKFVGNKSSDELAEEIADSEKSTLCVVNTRKKCKELFKKVREKTENDGAYMLSKDLCPKDRKRIVSEIKKRLKQGDRIKLIATSIVEAGIDLDFQEAHREKNSLFSIMQTAGRCNRNRKQKMGILKVFEFSDFPIKPQEDSYQKAEITNNCLDYKTGQLPTSMSECEIVRNYSEKEIFNEGDKIEKSMRDLESAAYPKNKDELRSLFGFFDCRRFGKNFNMIKKQDSVFPIIVKYHNNENDYTIDTLIEELKRHINQKMMRKFQQYSVEIRRNDARRLLDCGLIEQLECQGEKIPLYALEEKNFNGKTFYENGVGINFELVQETNEFLSV